MLIGTAGAVGYAEAKASGQRIYYTKADIAFASSSVNVDVYSTYQASIPNQELQKLVTWSSSDIDVAYVDQDGFITTRSVGQSTISVNYENLSSSFTLNVFNSYSAPYFDITDTEIRLILGDVFDVGATLYYKNEVVDDCVISWKSSDDKVATVNGNKTGATVRGFAKGNTTIYVSATYKGVFVNTEIKVEVVERALTIGLRGQDVEMENGQYIVRVSADQYVDLKPEVYLDGVVSKTSITWSTNDSEIATITTSGVIYGVKEGETFVTGQVSNLATIVVQVIVM